MHHRIITLFAAAALAAAACQPPRAPEAPTTEPCAEALLAYAERYPQAEPTDLYKLVFQDLYGPGHLITDSATCADYIAAEVASMGDTTALPPYEYTLCSRAFVRVNLTLLADSLISLPAFTSAVLRSAQGQSSPDWRFVVSHSPAFKAAYHPHYRLVRSDIFEREILPLINPQPQP